MTTKRSGFITKSSRLQEVRFAQEVMYVCIGNTGDVAHVPESGYG